MSAEPSQSARIRKANQFIGADILWEPLSKATHTNELWTATVHGNQLILRLNAPPQQAFGVSREAEQQVLLAINDYAWAPDILACEPQQGWCLMGFHGASLRVLQSGNALSPKVQQLLNFQLVKAVTEMQRIAVAPVTDYSALLNLYRTRFAKAEFADARGAWQSQLQELEVLLSSFNRLPRYLVHHDLHAGNICWLEEQQRLVIIDWEYAGIGIPWLDIAQLLNSGLLGKTQLAHLPLWQQYLQQDVADFLERAGRINELLENLWLLVNR